MSIEAAMSIGAVSDEVFRIDGRLAPGRLVLAIVGGLGSAESVLVTALLAAAIADGYCCVLVDLTDPGIVGPAGLAAVTEAGRRLDVEGHPLTVRSSLIVAERIARDAGPSAGLRMEPPSTRRPFTLRQTDQHPMPKHRWPGNDVAGGGPPPATPRPHAGVVVATPP